MFPQKTMLTNPLFIFKNQKQKLLHLLVNLNNTSMLAEVLTNKEANLEAMLLTEAEAGNALKNMPVRLTLMT